MRARIFLLAVLGVVAIGCAPAFGNRYAYHTIVGEPRVTGTAALGVATHDARDYVQSGKESPQLVGFQRGGYGNPFNVRTEDDKPLADNMTTAIVNTLNRKGFKAQPVIVAHTLSPDAARRHVLRAGADRALVLTIREWKSDTAMRIFLTYDVTMTVFDRAGTVLGEKRLQGLEEMLGKAGMPSCR